MKRDRYPLGRTALAAVAAVAALVAALGVQGAAARPAASQCTMIVTGAPWTFLRAGSGSSYTLKARGMSCSVARPWVVKLTRLKNPGTGATFKGPLGLTCRSFSITRGQEKLLYSGVCLHPPGVTFFEWGPKP